MLSVEKSIRIILKDITTSKSEKVNTEDALYRILASDVVSGLNIPNHNNSAMDGYVLSHLDLRGAKTNAPAVIKVIGESRAGTPFLKKVPKGCAVKIMTGASIPDGADCVVKIEDVKIKDGYLYIKSPVKKSAYVRFTGEDIKKGKNVLPKGKVLNPADIGVLSSMKKRVVEVYKRPSVAILCTGDELIYINDRMASGKVVSSNLYSLMALVKEAGGTAVPLGIVKDDRNTLKRAIKKGLKYDFLLTSGGISIGDYDYVKETLGELGAKLKVFKVSMRPGKPFSYFTRGATKIFALPGNPVSCMVSFELFARPAILKAQGMINIFRRRVEAVLDGDIQKIKGYRFFIRGIIRKTEGGYNVRLTGPQGSGILCSMSGANCLIATDSSRDKINKGEKVSVIVIDDSFDNEKSF